MRHIKKLRRQIQNKRCGILSRDDVMLPDNAHPHTTTTMQVPFATVGWAQVDHPPYSPDLPPSDLHVFLRLKTFLGGQQFHHDSEVKEAVITWFASQVASFYNIGIQKLVPRYNKCLNDGGNYVEK
jgi:hypothetical protein